MHVTYLNAKDYQLYHIYIHIPTEQAYLHDWRYRLLLLDDSHNVVHPRTRTDTCRFIKIPVQYGTRMEIPYSIF